MATARLGLILTRIAAVALGAVSGIYITRYLGTEGRGFFATLMGWNILVIQFLLFGLPSAYLYFGSRRAAHVPRLLGNLRYWLAGIALLLLAFWTVAALLRDPSWATLAVGWLCALYCWLNIAQVSGSAVLVAIGKIGQSTGLELANRVLLTLLYVALVAAGLARPVFCLVAATLAGAVWTLATFLLLPAAGRPSRRLAGCAWNYGSKFYAYSFLIVTIAQADLLFVDGLLGHSDAGLYSVATTLLQMATFPFQTYFELHFPRLAARPSFELMWKDFLRLVPPLLAGCALVLLGLQWVGPAIVALFGSEFEPASQLLFWMQSGFVLQVLVEFSGQPAKLARPGWDILIPGVIAALSTLLLHPILIREHGLAGAAFGYCAVRGIWLVGVWIHLALLHGRQAKEI